MSGRVLRACGVLLVVATAGCGDPQQRSFCESYASYLAVATPALEADPSDATADEAADVVTSAFDAARRLRADADSRFASTIDQLTESLDDLRRTLESFDGDEPFDAWEPLVNDTIIDIRRAHAQLAERVGDSCEPVT